VIGIKRQSIETSAELKAAILVRQFVTMAAVAERLQFAHDERVPIAAMAANVIGDSCWNRTAKFATAPTQRFNLKLIGPPFSPALQLVP